MYQNIFNKAKTVLIVLLIIIFSLDSVIAQEKNRSLASEEWEFKMLEDTSWLKAKIPGTVHTDLMRNGVIKNPFLDESEDLVQWVGKKEWTYRTTFKIKQQELDNSNIDLVFDGLDTFAD